jgi:hypothetical protein
VASNQPTLAGAANADDFLAVLAGIAPDNRYMALSCCGVKILREVADLCGVSYADTLTKRATIAAILENF